MRGDAKSMVVLTPRTAAAAVQALADDPKAIPLAGGTDLMVGWNMGLLNGRAVVDLSRVAEWKNIRVAKTSVFIGALVTHSQIQAHPVLRARFPLLVAACATVGAAQIQNRGTLGGNVANASPAGDSFPPLAVYDARVHCVGAGGRRVLPLLSVFVGVKKTALLAGELIEAIELPFPAKAPARGVFRKVGTRAAQAISKTMFAGLLWMKKDGTVEDVRLAFGSLAPTVRRLAAAEAFLKGRKLDAASAAGAADLLSADVSPIDDIRSTRDYRLAVSRNLIVRFLEGALR
ncbi:MAG: FAD binding domain-containing protein [Elusimicrobia bacterium]|nr:FAD binding domain-containing protein [Elusimicrobiota bacterium]MDE2510030.1 FAD binding domain-containing protein [Elusimicrobiota bacterium]